MRSQVYFIVSKALLGNEALLSKTTSVTFVVDGDVTESPWISGPRQQPTFPTDKSKFNSWSGGNLTTDHLTALLFNTTVLFGVITMAFCVNVVTVAPLLLVLDSSVWHHSKSVRAVLSQEFLLFSLTFQKEKKGEDEAKKGRIEKEGKMAWRRGRCCYRILDRPVISSGLLMIPCV